MDGYSLKNRTFLGEKLFCLMEKAGAFLGEHMWLWVILNLTWGLLGTSIGLLISGVIFLLPVKKTYSRVYGVPRVMFGDNWGGLSCSFFTFVANNMGEEWTEHVTRHEIGHTFQNAVLGPFFPFLVMIPSMVRYHIFRIRRAKGKPNPDYDAIWFEGSATSVGSEYAERRRDKKVDIA